MRTLKKITPFTERVIKVVRSIPLGKVATYQQVAALAGKSGASRGVSWILSSCSKKYKLPWHRVINSKGAISFDPRSSSFTEQKKRLESEGVRFTSRAGLNLKKYQWRKSVRKASSRAPTIFS